MDSRSMPQFQSEEDNSAFLEGRVLLGALNGSGNASAPPQVVVSGASHAQMAASMGDGRGPGGSHQAQQAPFGSKQLSPI